MSAAAPPPSAPTDHTAAHTAGTAPAIAGEACPLCGAPLHPAQEWCLRCGAAARTRLAAAPNWKGLVIALAVVIVLSLGVLTAALVSLAGGSSSAQGTASTPASSPAATVTSSTAATVTATPPASTTPAATSGATTPAQSTPATTPPG